MVFARKTGSGLTSLVKKLDEAQSKNKKMKSFICFLSDDEKLGDELKALAEKQGIKNTVLAIDNVAGPAAYKVAKEAEYTVLFYNKRKVEVNHAFRAGELNEKAVATVVADLSKILE